MVSKIRTEDKAKVLISLAAISAAGMGLYYFLSRKEKPVCTEGETQTKTCPDGSVITTGTCVDGKWKATGNTCVSVCTEGDTKCEGSTRYQCISNQWAVVESCAYGCSPDGKTCNPAPICTEGDTKCENNALFRCINNKWVGIQSCAYGCSPDGKTCNPAPAKETLLVAYASIDDYSAAKLIYDDLKNDYDVTFKNCASLAELNNYDAVAIVGGQYAWEQCFVNLFTSLYFSDINETHTGGVYVQKRYAPTVVYAVAGWSIEDTERSATYFSAKVKEVGLINVGATL